MSKKLVRAFAVGTLISLLLFCVEKFGSGHSPRTLALPGWIAVIQVWGFEGERGGVWAWVVFIVGNAFAYWILALVAFSVFDRFSGKQP